MGEEYEKITKKLWKNYEKKKRITKKKIAIHSCFLMASMIKEIMVVINV